MRHFLVCSICVLFLWLGAASVHPVTNAGPKQTLKQSWITFLSHRTGDNVLYRMRRMARSALRFSAER